MKQALLIIDVQTIMFTEDGGVWNGDKVISNIQTLLNKARSRNTPVIYIQHNTRNKEPMAIGSTPWEIDNRIKPLESEIVIAKTSWDSFLETNLESVLSEMAIDRLIITGMQTDFCVDTTVRRAYSVGFRNNIVVSDGHTTFDTKILKGQQIVEHHNSIWGGRFAKLIEAKDVHFLNT